MLKIIKLKHIFLCALALLVGLSACTSEELKTSTNNQAAITELIGDSSKASIIKFYAEWCATCKEYAPIFDKVAAEYQDEINFYSIDIEDSKNKSLVRELKVARLPETAFISADRQNITKALGPLSEEELISSINKLKAL